MAHAIKTKAARAALKPRREPYWSRVRAGLFVGYRRLEAGDGTWIARRRAEDGNGQQYRALGDLSDFLATQRYDAAVKLAEGWGTGVDQGATHKPVTVGEACKAYVTHQTTHKSKEAGNDAKGRFARLVYGKTIEKIALDKLRTTHLRTWLNDQLDEDGDEDDLRRSKDSANRNLNALKAALNLALKDRLVATDAGWKTVTPFQKVGKRRDRFLDGGERAALLAKCEPGLAALVRALLLTAVRPGEIAKADVSDFDKKQGTLRLTGKTGTRTVTLSTAAVAFFADMSKNKLPSAPLLTDAYGNRWNKDAWKKRYKDAVTEAKLPQDIVMYTLRHTGISEMIAGGMDSFIVARLAGTSTAMIDKHYGHLRHDKTRAMLDAVGAA